MSGTVYSNEDGSALPGAMVSVVDGATSATVQAGVDGGWHFDLPVGATVFIRAETSSFVPMVRGIVVPSGGLIRDYYLPAVATLEGWGAATGTSFDSTKGIVWVSYENASVAGYTSTLSASHDPSSTLDPGTSLPTNANATLGGGLDYWFLIFPNVAPSSTSISLMPPAGHQCVPRADIASWNIYPGAITFDDADCD